MEGRGARGGGGREARLGESVKSSEIVCVCVCVYTCAGHDAGEKEGESKLFTALLNLGRALL